MSYAICRVQKIGGAKDIAGVQLHNRREREHSNTNPDIDYSSSDLNYTLISEQSDKSYNTLVDERLNKNYTGKKAIRKDAVRMCEVLFTSDGDFFSNLASERQHEYFQDCYKFACDRYDKENIISATIHLDEETPHMHIDFVPLTKDGRLSAKEVLGGRSDLQQLQDDFFQSVGKKYNLERGKRADIENENEKPKKHLTTAEMKKKTEKELAQKENQLQQLQDDISKLTATLTDKEIEKIDTTPKRITGGFKGLSPEQAQDLVNTSKALRKENKSLRKQIKTISAEKDEASERARTAEDKANTIQFSVTRSYSAQVAELGNQTRLLKKVVGIPEAAKYDDIHRILKEKGLLAEQQNKKGLSR